MHKILYPLRYFRLENSEKKTIDRWPTLAIATLLAAPFVFFSGANFFGSGGFLSYMISLTGALTGFYVAALVAAATFSHPDLDKTIKSGPIALIGKDENGNRISELLSRREFACLIFGFLAFSAMAFTIYAAAAIPLAQSFPKTWILWSYDARKILSAVAIFVSCLWISHLFITTTLGLYYLMDRLYRHDRKVITKKPDRQDAA